MGFFIYTTGVVFCALLNAGAKLWMQPHASKAVFSSIHLIDEKTGLEISLRIIRIYGKGVKKFAPQRNGGR